MRSHVIPRGTVRAAAALIAVLCAATPALRAQSGTDARFESLVALAEAKMKEFGVPGVALGIVQDGAVSTRGIGITNVEDPLPVDRVMRLAPDASTGWYGSVAEAMNTR